MQRPNVLSSLLLVTSVAAWLFLASTAGLETSAFLLLFLSSGILVLTAVAGLLLGQSRWAQRLALGLVGIQILPVFLLPPTLGWWAAAAVAVVTAFALSGPATTVRVGLLPTAPPASAAVLMLALVSMPLTLALVSLETSPPALGWLVAGASLLLAWAFGKVSLVALWLSRTVQPIAVAGLALYGPWPAAWLLVAGAVAIAWFAWQGETHIATVPLIPERHHPKPVFPELTPPEVLDSAGLDSRGRRA
jgi:hypothetical protein